MKSFRWAVSLKETMSGKNFESNYRKAVMSVSEEDVGSQRSFLYKEDSLACLIGRLLIRKAACESLNIEWNKLEFDRTFRGKPYLMNNKDWNFNVSHQGDMVVLATSPHQIGVDVMRIDEDRAETASIHIDRLHKQFTDQESELMKSYETELDRWRAFYRVWCLKEAILKSTGIGLTKNLRQYDFVIDKKDMPFEPGCYLTSTKYFHNDVEQTNWLIEESFVNHNHCAAVAMKLTEGTKIDDLKKQQNYFEVVSIDYLLQSAQFVNVSQDFCDCEEFEHFQKKRDKHF